MGVGIDQKGVADPMKPDEEKPKPISPTDAETAAQTVRTCRGPIEKQHQPGIGQKQQRESPKRFEAQRPGGT